MKLNTRFALLLGFLLLGLIASVFLLSKAHERQMRRAVALLQREQAQQLDQILSLTTYPLQQFTRDYSLWDEMLEFVSAPTQEWARINIEASLDTFKLAGVLVLDPEGRPVYRGQRAPVTDEAWPTVEEGLRERLQRTPFLHYFAKVGDELFEVQSSPIQPSSDTTRASPAQGWLIAFRHWDTAYLQSLAEITRAQISVESPALPASTAPTGVIEVTRELKGLNGQPLAQLRLHFEPEQLIHLREYGDEVLLVLSVQGALCLIGLIVGLRLWILNPFARISASLGAHDAAPVKSLTRSESELGHIARLVEEYFAAEAALKRSEASLTRALDERVRIGRELHDGVIQNIYAAGMGLAAMRDTIPVEPAAAQKKVDEIRATLNETIREVRSHIVRLELGELQPKTFRQSVQEIADAIGLRGEADLILEIDEEVADRLPVNQRTNALQLVRDTVQSAVRTRSASRFAVQLRQVNGSSVLSISDNGTAISPPPRPSGEERAHERVSHEHLPTGQNRTSVVYSTE